MSTARTTESRAPWRAGRSFPTLPPLVRLALLLDLDGTLVDIAPTPSEVVVPPGLSSLLGSLTDALGGALAIVSGRTIDSVLGLLAQPRFAIVGEHGAVLRRRDGSVAELVHLAVPEQWHTALIRLAAEKPGLLLEKKPHSLVLHYRKAADAGAFVERTMRALVAEHAEDFFVAPARMAWEIRPRGVDKGTAVSALLTRAPFAGRIPIFVGDDVTDRDGIRAAEAVGGFGFEVASTFGDAAGVRAWLSALLARSAQVERGA